MEDWKTKTNTYKFLLDCKIKILDQTISYKKGDCVEVKPYNLDSENYNLFVGFSKNSIVELVNCVVKKPKLTSKKKSQE